MSRCRKRKASSPASSAGPGGGAPCAPGPSAASATCALIRRQHLDGAAVEDRPSTEPRSSTPARPVELVEARREQRLDRRRHDDVAVAATRAPSPPSPRRTADSRRPPRGSVRGARRRSRRPRRLVDQLPPSRRRRAARAGRVVALSLPPPQPARRSSSSGRPCRAPVSGRHGAGRRCARPGRATSPRPSARRRRRRRPAASRHRLEQLAHGPGNLLDRRRRLPRRAVSNRGRDVRVPPNSAAPIRPRESCLTISITGQYVMPSPYERQRPRSTVASIAREELGGQARLPDPGGAENGEELARARR